MFGVDKKDAVRNLTEDVKDQAKAWSQLKRAANEDPDRVLEYIAELPESWRRVPSRGKDRLLELERIALRAKDRFRV